MVAVAERVWSDSKAVFEDVHTRGSLAPRQFLWNKVKGKVESRTVTSAKFVSSMCVSLNE